MAELYDDGPNDRAVPSPSPETLAALRAHWTPDIARDVLRYAKQRARMVRMTGRPCPPLAEYARELVHDAHAPEEPDAPRALRHVPVPPRFDAGQLDRFATFSGKCSQPILRFLQRQTSSPVLLPCPMGGNDAGRFWRNDMMPSLKSGPSNERFMRWATRTRAVSRSFIA